MPRLQPLVERPKAIDGLLMDRWSDRAIDDGRHGPSILGQWTDGLADGSQITNGPMDWSMEDDSCIVVSSSS